MPVPEGMTVSYYIVTDGPPDAIQVSDHSNIRVVGNHNPGAHSARNAGLEAGSGDYILFIDDDVFPEPDLLQSYKEAIQTHPDSIGFVGVVNFPGAENAFEKGVVASYILTFFGIARTQEEVTWGVTANLMVKREAVGSIRFSKAFPKHGGGEDIDFCLRIDQKAGKEFVTVPNAAVNHPWWGGGTRQYRRFARWAYGDSRLPGLFPEFKYRNFPNMIEATALGVCVLLIIGVLNPKFVLGVGWVIALGFLAEFGFETWSVARRGIGSFRTGVESSLVRLSNEVGRVIGNLQRGHVGGFCERFDYFTTGKSIPYERKAARTKFGVFVLGFLAFLILLR
jgi:GT2 family glycosyltransferase